MGSDAKSRAMCEEWRGNKGKGVGERVPTLRASFRVAPSLSERLEQANPKREPARSLNAKRFEALWKGLYKQTNSRRPVT